MLHDKTAQNELFDVLDDTVMDFSEKNPFGDVGSCELMTTGQISATEQSLYSNLIVEAIQIHGHDVYYLDRTLVAEDTVLGEDATIQV
jgi:hypothetical protein